MENNKSSGQHFYEKGNEENGMRFPKVTMGIQGLDEILEGGLPPDQTYLIQGSPGTGKTTLGLQFLLEGRKQGETVLYITLNETKKELKIIAESHGWSLDDVHLYHLTENGGLLREDKQQTVFHPSEVELTEMMKDLFHLFDQVQPGRLVIDSLSEIRLMAETSLHYRHQILALRKHFSEKKCTVLLLDDMPAKESHSHIMSMVHGVIELNQSSVDIGCDRRRLRVIKIRGMAYNTGYHDFSITPGGLKVFPRMIAAEYRHEWKKEIISSGIDELDSLIGGGLDKGSSMALLGPSGCGKSTVAMQFAIYMAEQGERVAIYAFDESVNMILMRAEGLGMNLKDKIDKNLVSIRPIDPAELSPGEFSQEIREQIIDGGVKMVIIDSLTGYLKAMPGDRLLMLHLHELLFFLGHHQVCTLLSMTQHGAYGEIISDVDVSYLADAVLLFRYFEYQAEIKKAISVFKRRSGPHEKTIRELIMNKSEGIQISEPLRQFRGILTGIPVFEESPKIVENQ